MFDRIWKVVKHEPRPALQMEKPLLKPAVAWVGWKVVWDRAPGDFHGGETVLAM